MNAGRRLAAWPGSHPDLAALVLILGLGLLQRALFQFRVPVLVTKDSPDYYMPALHLAGGEPFDLPERRTPLYSLFIAATIGFFGTELLALTFVQHLLGLVSAGLTYALGRATFGRAVGLFGGLVTALSGPLLVYEHHVMSETLFTFSLVLAALLVTLAARRRGVGLELAAGAAVGLAILARPVAQVLLPLVPMVLLVGHRRWRSALSGTILIAIGVGLLVGPWILRNRLVHGSATAAGSGRFLIARVLKWDRGFVFYPPLAAGSPRGAEVAVAPLDPSDRLNTARRFAQETTNVGPSPHTPMERLQTELGLTEAEADDLLRQVALEAILGNPIRYLGGTGAMFVDAVMGRRRDEGLRMHLEDHLQPDVMNRFPGAEDLLGPPTAVQQAEAPSAEWLVLLVQPYRFAAIWIPLYLIGSLAALRCATARPALFYALGAPLVLLASVAVVGGVPRYRYPLDPFIALTAGGGTTWLLGLVRAGARRLRRPGRSDALPGTVEVGEPG